ncbi:hypothetical protein HPP92_011711 [Vanilla planifolia]|uniref:PLAC8 family protein n=1 Tax=Vanilla planifolia TaxID=51239 RepID=A0A835RCW6_VANPL|nr:hypothetical protein HPP92_011711 [Vanilla planifolia]
MAHKEEEEASPLLDTNTDNGDGGLVVEHNTKFPPAPVGCGDSGSVKWAAEGVPVSHGSVVGEPLPRDQWDSGLFACFGRNDEFCSSDLEVCLLGSFAPCVLYGGNIERLGSAPGTFTQNCLPYAGLYMLGNCFFGWNCLAPWLSYPGRTAIRQKFNLEGNWEALARSIGCHGVLAEEPRREQLESICDLSTHVLCHPCALCQEGRELRRRLPHPGFAPHLSMVMMPPMEQKMGRHAA